MRQLEDNKLVPHLLKYPTYTSYIRWSQEIYYLIEIKEYTTSRTSMNMIYEYQDSDLVSCWVWMFVISLIYRLVAYVALVKKQE